MNGVKYNRNGKLISKTLSVPMRTMRLIWAAPTISEKNLKKIQKKICDCFMEENWEAIGVRNEIIPFEEIATKVRPCDLERFELPAEEKALCVLIFRASNLTQQTQDNLEQFAENFKNTHGFQFKIIVWN